MPTPYENFSPEDQKRLRDATKDFQKLRDKIAQLEEEKKAVARLIVEMAFGDGQNGKVNLQNGMEVGVSFATRAKVLETEFLKLKESDALPSAILNTCFRSETKLVKDMYGKLSQEDKDLLAPCLEFSALTPSITIRSVPAPKAKAKSEEALSM